MSDADRLLYNKADAAAQLSISERVLERLIKDGDLDTVQIGRRRLVPAEALVEYVERIKASA